MTAANFITLFGIVAVAFFGSIVLLDWLGRRKDRETQHHATK
jgi:preprotein translocase subunit SecG